jgi:hypothetical protein
MKRFILVSGLVAAFGCGGTGDAEISNSVSALLGEPVAVCQDVTLDAGENCWVAVMPSDVDGGSSGGTLTVTPGTVEGPGGWTVELTVTDESGSSDTCAATVLVSDVTPPALVVPDDVTLACSSEDPPNPADTGFPTWDDNCDDNPVIYFWDAVTPESIVYRTWGATDFSGNSASEVQTITCATTSGLTDIIEDLLDQGVIDSTQANSLEQQVASAEKQATKDHICAAVHQLEGFINRIEGQAGHKLSTQAAADLIAYTMSVIEAFLNDLPEGDSC